MSRAFTLVTLIALTVPAVAWAAWPTNPATNLPVCTYSKDQKEPSAVPDNSGGAIIAWTDFRRDTSLDIFAQRVTSAGAVSWTPDGVAICTAFNGQTSPV